MSKIVLKKFSADWCGPCRMMAPLIKSIERQYDGSLEVLEIDIDKTDEDLSTIKAIPTLVFLKDGQEVHRTVGSQSEAALKAKINELL